MDLEIDTSARVLDLEEDRFDLALRFGTDHYPGLVAELLVDEQLCALASPEYVQQFGRKRSVADLQNATLIHSKSFSWNQWFKAAGEAISTSSPKGLVFVDVAAAIDAAVHGLGVVLANRGTTVIPRRTGSLIPFVDVTIRSHRHYYGVYRANSPRYETIRDFLDWIKPLVVKTFV